MSSNVTPEIEFASKWQAVTDPKEFAATISRHAEAACWLRPTPRLMLARGAVRRGREMGVAKSAPSAFRDADPLAFDRQVTQQPGM